MNAINLHHNAILAMCQDRPAVTTAVVHPVQSKVLQATAEAAGKAVEMAASGRAEAVMKVSLHSDELLSCALAVLLAAARTEGRVQ